MKLKRSVETIMRELASATKEGDTLVCIYADKEGNIKKVIGGRNDYMLLMINKAIQEILFKKEK